LTPNPILAASGVAENCIPWMYLWHKRSCKRIPRSGVQLSAILSRISIPNKTLDALTAHGAGAPYAPLGP